MKKDNISTQTLLEVMLQEMEQVKAYTQIIKKIGPQLNSYLQEIQKQEIKVDTKQLDLLLKEIETSAHKFVNIPTWFLIITLIGFMIAIIEGLLLYFMAISH